MVSRRANAVLDRNPSLFSFLPAINFGYLYYTSPSEILGFLSILSLAMGAFIYNYSRGSPDEVPTWILTTYVISFAGWVGTYLLSLYELFKSSKDLNRMVVVLLFITIGFLFVGISHIILKFTAEGYEHEY
jgi:hypothetical protein